DPSGRLRGFLAAPARAGAPRAALHRRRRRTVRSTHGARLARRNTRRTPPADERGQQRARTRWKQALFEPAPAQKRLSAFVSELSRRVRCAHPRRSVTRMRLPALACALACNACGGGEAGDVRGSTLVETPAREFPAKLSQVGLYDDLRERQPSPRALPYVPRSALWSNGLAKERFIVVPE